jgi:hypothetical protein
VGQNGVAAAIKKATKEGNPWWLYAFYQAIFWGAVINDPCDANNQA